MSNRILLLFTILTFFSNLRSLDYRRSIEKSFSFFNAQRSGALTDSNNISWRQDAAVDDGLAEGVDLSGGWFVDGYYYKFNFPMAASVTLLALSAIENKEAYKNLNLWETLLDTIKWPLDYLIKCHVSDNEFYAQCGDPIYGPFEWEVLQSNPEIPRKCFKIDEEHPGSDLAGEASAAMALSAIAFSGSNDDYAALLTEHSIKLYNFANNYRGLFYKYIPGADSYYKSTEYIDELILSSISLYISTGNIDYLEDAESFWEKIDVDAIPYYQNYDDKTVLATLLLAKHTTNNEKKHIYLAFINSYFNRWITMRDRLDDKLILLEFNQSLRYSLYSAAIAIYAYANFSSSEIEDKEDLYQIAKTQIEFVMNHNSRNYMVGYDENSPKNPHHIMSSCPVTGACGFNYIETSEPNVNELTGAIVSGPTNDGIFDDDRKNIYTNSIGVDINAAYLYGAVSILKKEGLLYQGDDIEVDIHERCAKELERWDMCSNSWWKTQCAATCCKDNCPSNLNECRDYRPEAECLYMKNSGKCLESWWGYVCQKTCNTCDRDSCYSNCNEEEPAEPVEPCVDDANVYCNQWNSWEMCKNSYFLAHCKKTCCVCQCPENLELEDYDQNCPSYASWACNQHYWRYMCQKTCNAPELNKCSACL